MPLSHHSAQGLRLSQVVSGGQWFFADNEPRVRSCSNRFDQCQPGDLFVVLDDPDLTTQEQIEEALERGATALLCERPIPVSCPQFVVSDCRIAFGQLCHALANSPCRSLRTVGVTGTYGKSSVQNLLEGIFHAAGQSSTSLTSSVIEGLGPLQIAHSLAEARLAGQQVATLEASSLSLSRHLLSGTELDAAVFTNVRREHASQHGTLLNYQNAKKRLVNHLKPGGVAVLNTDDPVCRVLIEELDVPVMTYGLVHPAELTATVLERHACEQTFLLEAGDESHVVRTPIIGDGHVANCLAAAAVGLVAGLDLADIIRGLEMVEAAPGCLQRVECGQPFSLFVDHSATPHALANLLGTLRKVTTGNLICLLGVDHRQAEATRAQTGRVLERWCDTSVLTASRLDRKMALNAAHDVLDGFDRPAQAHVMPQRARAICWALEQAQAGDLVVLAGGTPADPTDDESLSDEDVSRYWLQHADRRTACPWLPA